MVEKKYTATKACVFNTLGDVKLKRADAKRKMRGREPRLWCYDLSNKDRREAEGV